MDGHYNCIRLRSGYFYQTFHNLITSEINPSINITCTKLRIVQFDKSIFSTYRDNNMLNAFTHELQIRIHYRGTKSD